MKFDMHLYWKHEKCKDVFFCASKVRFDDDCVNVILSGTWCTQGTAGWWFTEDDKIKVTPEQYDLWKKYTPKGRVRL